MQRSARKIRVGILLSDLLWVIPAFQVALALRDMAGGIAGYKSAEHINVTPIAMAGIAGWAVIHVRMHLGGFRRGWSWGKVASELLVGTAILVAVVSVAAYPFLAVFPRREMFYFFVSLIAGFFVIRVIALGVVASSRAHPRKRVLIMGSGPVARHLCDALERHSEMAAEVVGFLSPPGCESDCQKSTAAMHQGVPAVEVIDLVREKGVTDVIAVLSGNPAPQKMLDMLGRLRSCGIRGSVVPYSYELFLSKPVLVDVDGLPLLSLDAAESGKVVRITKRALDLGIVAVLTLPAAVCISVAALILTFRKGTWLRKEVRCGQGGARFAMYRMNVDRAALSSRFERLLDLTGMTELPQLWNVVRGEMSMVGPRPEAPERVKLYSEWQQQRLRVKPGITGLAQVHGLREESSSQAKAQFDLEYLVCWSPLSDLVLVTQTVWTVVLRICRTLFRRESERVGRPAILHVDRAQSSAD